MNIETHIDFDNERNQEYICPLCHDIICPMLKSNGTENNILNWNISQCIIRIAENNRCTFRCPVAIKLRLDSTVSDDKGLHMNKNEGNM